MQHNNAAGAVADPSGGGSHPPRSATSGGGGSGSGTKRVREGDNSGEMGEDQYRHESDGDGLVSQKVRIVGISEEKQEEISKATLQMMVSRAKEEMNKLKVEHRKELSAVKSDLLLSKSAQQQVSKQSLLH